MAAPAAIATNIIIAKMLVEAPFIPEAPMEYLCLIHNNKNK